MKYKRYIKITLGILAIFGMVVFIPEGTILASISSTPVQQGAGQMAAGCSSFTITMPSTPANGDLLTFTWGYANTLCSVSSISSSNTTWDASATKKCATNRDVEVWKGLANASAGTVVTINLTGAGVANGRSNISEWSASGATWSADVAGSQLCNANTSTARLTATTTPTASINALIIAKTSGGGATSTNSGSGFTDLSEVSNSTPSAYLVVPSTSGSYSTGWTFTTNASYDAAIVVFKAVVAATATGPVHKFVFAANHSFIFSSNKKYIFQ